jgi:hypothetical protein
MERELIGIHVGQKLPFEDVLEKMMGKEGASLSYIKDRKGLDLYVTVPEPTKKEINAFRRGLIRFALYRNYMLNTAIIMVFFESDLVFDLVFDINTLDADMDGVVEGNALYMYFLDSKTGIVEGIRPIGLGRNFMKEINSITKNDGRYNSKEFSEWLQNDVFQKSLTQLWEESERIDWDR